MRITILNEPHLEFANGSRHIDPRHGITNYGPADAQDTPVRTIRAGIVGPQTAIEGVQRWLDSCREPINAKHSHLGHLYVPFPGFDTDRGFRSTIVWNSRLERPINSRALKRLQGLNPLTAVQDAVNLYDAELAALNEEPNCDVVIVCRPDDLPEQATPAQDSTDGSPSSRTPSSEGMNFRSLLKARSMKYSQPIQILRRSTWDPTHKETADAPVRQKQDEATRAWNLHTALYYKAGGVPWRLPRDPSDLTSCYVGVAFYRALDEESLQTSVAQVFNQRGDGVIVRGGQATVSKDDRQPHLSEDDAYALLEQALHQYRSEHRTTPARVVLHKTSSFTPAEIAGFNSAADSEHLSVLELVWIGGGESIRLFRRGEQPPLRGTLLTVTDERHILYTRGSVPFYKPYPGMYVPTPLGFRTVETQTSPEKLAEEILSLTKMNWNQTQLDARKPITLRTADTVGDILRHLAPGERPAARYAFYM